MTGRGLGYCAGNDFPGYGMGGRGLGRGWGGGRWGGWGMRFRRGYGYGRMQEDFEPNVSRETLLENEARILKEQLTTVEKQLEALKKKGG